MVKDDTVPNSNAIPQNTLELNDAERLILQEKLPVALLYITNTRITYISEVANAINSNFAHTKKVVARLEELELVSSFIQGRTRYLHLTPKGYHISEILKFLRTQINEPPEAFEFPAGNKEFSAVSEMAHVSKSSWESNEIDKKKKNEKSAQEEIQKENSEKENTKMNEKKIVVTPEILKDPTLLSQIETVLVQINNIYNEWEREYKKSETDVLRSRLGPLDRELKRIEQTIYQKGINDPILLKNFKRMSETYSSYMKYESNK